MEGWNRSSIRAVVVISPVPLDYGDEEQSSRRSSFGTVLVTVSCESPSWDLAVASGDDLYELLKELEVVNRARFGGWEHPVESYPLGVYRLEAVRTWFVEPGSTDPETGKRRSKKAVAELRRELMDAIEDDEESGYSGVTLHPLTVSQRFLLETGELGPGVEEVPTRQRLLFPVPGVTHWRRSAPLWDDPGAWPVARRVR